MVGHRLSHAAQCGRDRLHFRVERADDYVGELRVKAEIVPRFHVFSLLLDLYLTGRQK